jgi:copper(I)-binding protein
MSPAKILAPSLLVLALGAGIAETHEFKQGAITIDHPWSRATAPGQSTGAGYMVVLNQGNEPDQLVGASSPAAARVEIHTHSVDSQGVARMREVSSVELPAGGEIRFAPGALHLMLVDLAQPLKAGQNVPLTLSLEKAGRVEVQLTVEAPGMNPAMQHHGSGSSH